MPPSRRCWSSMVSPPCHCERSEAIQNESAEAVWIASSLTLLAMMLLLLLRQEPHHRIGEGVRLLDIGDVGGIENGEVGAGNLAADQFTGGDRGRHVLTAGDHQRRALDLWQQFALIQRRQRLAAGEIALDRRRQ